ncbi:MAG: hypothetical protein VB089_15190 [Anaerolineaceae bacterium]|nr:hypothetical protein [Anaerolineaceae bacterium]
MQNTILPPNARYAICILFLFLVASCSSVREVAPRDANPVETILVAQKTDPYYSLAEKIAQTEQLEIVEEVSQVVKLKPRYILWVASPQNLSKESLLAAGRVFKDEDYYPGLGILSGATLEKAEQLWARRGQAGGNDSYIGGDVEVTQLIDTPTIFKISDGAPEKMALNKDRLIAVLQQADYLYWSRHSGGMTWYWNSESGDYSENDAIRARDLPLLDAAVIYTASCSTFRPWLANSIALGFVDHGAVAYVGDVNSPFHTNALLRHGSSVPGPTSWQEFPLGIVAQVENKAATRAYFRIPQYFMLGDPRVYLSPEQPYQILSDTIDPQGKRIIAGTSDQNSILALKIDNGAGYDFLTVQGVTSVSEKDLFHNSKLQTLDLGADKYVLLLHQAGPFKIELSRKAPFLWGLMDILSDALDYTWVVLWLDVKVINTPLIYLICLPIFVAILLVKVLVQKKPLKDYRKIFLMAVLLALVHAAYFGMRWEAYSISANRLNPSADQIALGCTGVFACAAGGLMLMKDTRKIAIKILGLVYAVLPQFLLAGFYLVFITFMNMATPINGMTSPWLWNYNAFGLAGLSFCLEVWIILVMYRIVIPGKKRGSELKSEPARG